MPTRRYTDDEVAEIFRRATATVQPRPAGEAGTSLAELQAIGREVGIPADRVAVAAASLEHGEVVHTQRLLGLPIGVGERIERERKLTDAEWDRLVVAARDTFHAKGRQRSEGAFRQWTNGNLQVLLEPGERGHRLRLQTTNQNAQGLMMSGLAMAGFAAVAATSSLFAVAAKGEKLLLLGGLLGMLGLVVLAAGTVRLPGWAARRRTQFRALAELAARMTQPE